MIPAAVPPAPAPKPKRQELRRLPANYQVPQGILNKINLAPPANADEYNLSASNLQKFVGMFHNRNYRNREQYDRDVGYDLLRAVGKYNFDIGFNPALTTFDTASAWLTEQQAKFRRKYNDWHIYVEDLDGDPYTPDDIIITNKNDIPVYVSGYYLKDGAKRRQAAILNHFSPTRAAQIKLRKDLKVKRNLRLFKRWLKEQSLNANTAEAFNQD
jgi:hypothetical protein